MRNNIDEMVNLIVEDLKKEEYLVKYYKDNKKVYLTKDEMVQYIKMNWEKETIIETFKIRFNKKSK